MTWRRLLEIIGLAPLRDFDDLRDALRSSGDACVAVQAENTRLRAKIADLEAWSPDERPFGREWPQPLTFDHAAFSAYKESPLGGVRAPDGVNCLGAVTPGSVLDHINNFIDAHPNVGPDTLLNVVYVTGEAYLPETTIGIVDDAIVVTSNRLPPLPFTTRIVRVKR